MSTFTVTVTVDYPNLRVGLENVYPSGNRYTQEPVNMPDRDLLNLFIVKFLYQQSESFGETCIHIVKFGTVEAHDAK